MRNNTWLSLRIYIMVVFDPLEICRLGTVKACSYFHASHYSGSFEPPYPHTPVLPNSEV